MVYKRSVSIGGGLLITVIALSAVIFYLSMGPCPEGTFACDNGTLCVPQRQICDERRDCADGSDEHPVECGMLYGSKEFTAKLVAAAIARRNERFEQMNRTSPNGSASACEIFTYPKLCTCRQRTVLHCGRNSKLMHIPKLSFQVTHLLILRNNLTIEDNSFRGLFRLARLTLKRDNISKLPTGLFNGLNQLEQLTLSHNNITTLTTGIFHGLASLQWLFLNSNKLKVFALSNLLDMPKLEWLYLTDNLLTLEDDRFPRMEFIFEIYLDYNAIELINEETFARLNKLHLLSLNFNRISHIHPKAFWGLKSIRDIRIIGNPIKDLSSETFVRTTFLDALYLGQTMLNISKELLQPLNVSYLNLTGIRFDQIEFKAVSGIINLKYVVFDRFYYCSMTPQVRMCKPNTDGVSSFEDLLSKPVLRYSAWIMGSITIIGNIMVLWGRFIFRDENRAVTMVIRNLALADILMGFYLLAIGIQDYRYRSIYHKSALDWITSWQCAAVGVLAVTSSEVSMLILGFMSLERFLLIANPFRRHHRISPKNIFTSLLSIWFMGSGIAIAPVILWRSSTKFYGTYSGTCFPLHIQEPYPLGWEYSAFLFLGLNLFLLIMIAMLYTALLVSIWRTRKATPLSLLDSEFAVRFFFIVLTDVLCWAPIIFVKIWVFFNYNISNDIYAWLVVFILPLNSAVNPLLYTFTTPKYRNQILLRGWKKFTSRRRAEASGMGTTTATTATASSNPDESQCKAMPLANYHQNVLQIN